MLETSKGGITTPGLTATGLLGRGEGENVDSEPLSGAGLCCLDSARSMLVVDSVSGVKYPGPAIGGG